MWNMVTISCGVPPPRMFMIVELPDTRRKDVVAVMDLPPSVKEPSHSPARDFNFSNGVVGLDVVCECARAANARMAGSSFIVAFLEVIVTSESDARFSPHL